MNKNYSLVKENRIKDQSLELSLYQHNKTKMEILFIKTDDNNRSFNISFGTPSPEKSGTTHILEHIVLGGSKKYPVKDPFFEVLKGSLNSTMNASTYEDKTKYYFSTTNTKDFDNLLDIYLDSVFAPLLSFESFAREGYREIYNLKTKKIEPQGIVYNEMQSVLDSVDFVIGKTNVNNLLPQYNYDYGGEPEKIHKITHKKIVDYYNKYYHPSNAHIIFYGDEFDLDNIFSKLDQYINNYDYKTIDKQPIVNHNDQIEKNIVQFYPALQNNGLHHFTMGYRFPDNISRQEALILEFLAYSLVISDNSIFKEELLSSGLGESMITDGFENGLPSTIFYFGLKNIRKENIPKAPTLISNALQIYYSHLTAKKVLQALKRLKYQLLKKHDNHGIHLSNLVDKYWNKGHDPFEVLEIQKQFNEVEKKIKNNDNYVKKVFTKYFLSNPNTTNIEFVPNTLLKKEFVEKEEERLSQKLKSLSQTEINKLEKESNELIKKITKPDTKKSLNTIPRLKLSDLNKFQKYPIYHRILDENNLRVFQLKEAEPNISNYVLSFKIEDIQSINLHYLGLYANIILKLDTITKTYQEVASGIENTIGELYCETYCNKTESGSDVFTVNFILSCLDENIKKSFEIFRDLLFNVKFTNKKRIKELVFEEYLELKEEIKYRSLIYSHTRALAGLESRYYFKDNTDGIEYYEFIKNLSENFDEKIDIVIQELQRIHDYLICRKLFICFASNEDQHFDQFRLCAKGNDLGSKLEQLEEPNGNNLILDIGTYVNSNAYAFSLQNQDHRISIISQFLSRDYLYNLIRVKQGAYSVSSMYLYFENKFLMLSYADPKVQETFNIFEKEVKKATEELTKENLENTIISLIGRLDKPTSVTNKCEKVLRDHFTGIKPEFYEEQLETIKNAKLEEMKKLGKSLFMKKNINKTCKVVIGNQTRAKEYFTKNNEDYDLMFL